MNINQITSKLGTIPNEKIAKCMSDVQFSSRLSDIKYHHGQDGVDEFLTKKAVTNFSQVLKNPKKIFELFK